MNKYLSMAVAVFLSGTALAETLTIESTGHYVRVNDPEMLELEGENEVYLGYQRHIAVEAKDGQTESHWCYGANIIGEESLAFGGGYCIAIDEDGDAYWTWFQVRRRGGFDWQVMGGTGKYEGSTGGGESIATNVMPDGSATLEITGTIELASN